MCRLGCGVAVSMTPCVLTTQKNVKGGTKGMRVRGRSFGRGWRDAGIWPACV